MNSKLMPPLEGTPTRVTLETSGAALEGHRDVPWEEEQTQN